MARHKGADSEEILRLRTELSIPALARIKEWAQAQDTALNPKSLVAIACRYMLKRWEKLTYYTTDPSILIDNNQLYPNFYLIPTFHLID